MWKAAIFTYAVFLLMMFAGVDNSIIQFDLTRSRSPHMSAVLDKIPGAFSGWLKPHPKHLNVTNITIALKRFMDNEFYGYLRLGSKNVTFNVVYDTAWTESWVVSSQCPSDMPGCALHTTYDHTKSSSYTKDGEPFNANMGTYNMTGFFSKDHINVGGSKILDFRFVEMTSIPKAYLFTKADGVIGLSMPDGKTKTMIERFLEQGTIKKPIFSIYLNRNRHSNRGGSIMLGAYDKKHIARDPKHNFEKFVYVDVVDDGTQMWKFALDAVTIDSGKKWTTLCEKCMGFIDSSANAIIGSKAEIEKINDAINARPYKFGMYTVECDQIEVLPKLDFTIAGQNFTLNGKQYVQKIKINDIQQICLSAFETAETSSEEGSWVIGGAFLAHFYSTYDLKAKKIGFVRAA